MIKKRKTIGLALGSGGVKGLAHVGVIRAFRRAQIPIDYMAGSSIGAWVAIHYALFQDIKRLEKDTVGRQKEKLATFLEPTLRGGLIKGIKMENLIREWMSDLDFKDAYIPVTVVATDLITGAEIIIDKGKVTPAVRASMSIPTLFKPYRWQGHYLVDGGVSNPVPDDVVKKMGADIVVAVNLNNYKAGDRFINEDASLYKVTVHSYELMRYHLAKQSMKSSDFIIEPKLPAINMNSWQKYFTKKVGPDLVSLGERAANKVIPEIKKMLK